MASPQIEDGYTKIANEILEVLARTRIPGEACQVLLTIIRKTYGFNKKEDVIALSQFCVATGAKKPAIVRALYKLLEMNLIIKKDNGNVPIYSLNKDYSTWKPLSKKITTFNKLSSLKPLCYICGFTEALEEHHIEPRSAGGSNRVENKINLCPNCHTLAHKGKYSKHFLVIKKDNIEKTVIIPETVIKNANGIEQTAKKPLSKKIHTKESINTKETLKEKKMDEASPVKLFIDHAFQTFQMKTKEKLLIDGGKDGAIVKKLLSTYELEKLKGLWDTFMQSQDPFIVQAGYSIGVFKSVINKLISGRQGGLKFPQASKGVQGILARIEALEQEGGNSDDKF